jgi:hypothetical protein
LEGRGNSYYHALQISARRPFSHGFSLLASYTFSHAEDNDSFDAKATRTYIASASDKSRAIFDQRNHFVLSYIYQLPWHQGRFKNPAASLAFAGWQVAGITTLQSGFPFDITTSIDYSERPTYFAQNMPNRICNGSLAPSQRKPTMWFDTSCFPTPAYGTLGNAGFELIDTDGVINQDLAIEKRFPIREPLNLQFRAEVFNLANHADFGRPDSTVEDATFGHVFSALAPREFQFALKLMW